MSLGVIVDNGNLLKAGDKVEIVFEGSHGYHVKRLSDGRHFQVRKDCVVGDCVIRKRGK